MRAGLRHIILKDGWIYLSSNSAGVVQRMRLDKLLDSLGKMKNHTVSTSGCWEECAVLGGARTIESSPSVRFIFAACNRGSKLCVVDTKTMKMVLTATVDSYPVGLDISKDGRIVILTSQGRNKLGGNAVNIFSVEYAEPESIPASEQDVPARKTGTPQANQQKAAPQEASIAQGSTWLPWALAATFVCLMAAFFFRRLSRK